MIQERVTAIRGKQPILIVAPYGADDKNTDVLANSMSDMLEGYAVINNGWKRGAVVDYKNEIADCNRYSHFSSYVVKEEFLNPINRFKKEILEKHKYMLLFCICGLKNRVRAVMNDAKLAYVIGWGQPGQYTCQAWIKDYMLYDLGVRDKQYNAYEGKEGGAFTGCGGTVIQLYNDIDSRVDAMQISVIDALKQSKASAGVTAQVLSIVIGDLMERSSGWNPPRSFKTLKI